jgi:hypothetical protein
MVTPPTTLTPPQVLQPTSFTIMDSDPAASRRKCLDRENQQDQTLYKPPPNDTTGNPEPSTVATTTVTVQQGDVSSTLTTKYTSSRTVRLESPNKKSFARAHSEIGKPEYNASGPAPIIREKRSLRSKCGTCGRFGHGVDVCPRKNTKEKLVNSTVTAAANKPLDGSPSLSPTDELRTKVVAIAPIIDKQDECKGALPNGGMRSKTVGDVPPPVVLSTSSVSTPTTNFDPLQTTLATLPADIPKDSRHIKALAGDFDTLSSVADKQWQITTWLASLPDNILHFLEPTSAPIYEASLYQDWLFWCTSRGRLLLNGLDRYETQHRAIGLKYHMIPYDMRHTVTTENGTKMSQQAVARLAEIYETNVPYNAQPLYRDWIGVMKAVRIVVEEVQRVEGRVEVQILSATHGRVVSLLDGVQKNLRRIMTSLHGIDLLVETFRMQRAAGQTDGAHKEILERLNDENSNEGKAIRKWMWTWAEAQAGTGGGTPAHVNELVRRLLSRGAEIGTFWRNCVPQRKSAESCETFGTSIRRTLRRVEFSSISGSEEKNIAGHLSRSV